MTTHGSLSGASQLQALTLRARFELRSLAGTSTAYLPYLRTRRRLSGMDAQPGFDMRVTDAEAALVIDGYLRSANTFAYVAFQQAQLHPLPVAHHGCSPAQVRAATRLGIPVLVIVRDPRSTIVSARVWNMAYSTRQWLRGYARYYEGIRRAVPQVAVASFDEVTTDFGAVIRRVNTRFGTCFGEYLHTPEHVAETFRRIEANDRRKFGTIDEHQVSRPSDARAALRRRAEDEYDAPKSAAMRRRAEDAYAAVLSATEASAP